MSDTMEDKYSCTNFDYVRKLLGVRKGLRLEQVPFVGSFFSFKEYKLTLCESKIFAFGVFRQLSRHLVGLWTTGHPTAMALLKRILVCIKYITVVILFLVKEIIRDAV